MAETGIWTKNVRGQWQAPPETPIDALRRVLAAPATTPERLEALANAVLHLADEVGMPTRPPPPAADYFGDVWPPPQQPASDATAHDLGPMPATTAEPVA